MKASKLSPEQIEQLTHLLNCTTHFVKTALGIANNAAWAACLDAMDHILQHPRYRQNIKGGSTPACQFKRCFDLLKKYENGLLYSSNYAYFHVADLTPKARKTWGDNITDEDYYNFWAAIGFMAYQSTKPFFTSLVNKIRLAYDHHGDPNAEIMGWAVAANSALDIAGQMWVAAVNHCPAFAKEYKGFSISKKEWEKMYRCFDLRGVADFWEKCVNDLCPKEFDLEELERKNIMAGYIQLKEQWMNENTIYDSRIKTAEDYADIFRTNGEMKKAMRQFAEMRDKMADEMKPKKNVVTSVT